MLKLIEQDDSLPTPLTGKEVLGLCSELIAEHLPTIPHDDPFRSSLVVIGLAVPRQATGSDTRRRIR